MSIPFDCSYLINPVRMSCAHLLSNFSGVGTCGWTIFIAILSIVSDSL